MAISHPGCMDLNVQDAMSQNTSASETTVGWVANSDPSTEVTQEHLMGQY